MNQRERNKFPRIYEIMQDLKVRDCDKQDWDELYSLLNELEPDYNAGLDYGAFNMPKYIIDIKKVLNEGLEIFNIYNQNTAKLYDLRHSLVNYTKPLEKRLKRAFIVVLGAMLSIYENIKDEVVRNNLFNQWLEYKNEHR